MLPNIWCANHRPRMWWWPWRNLSSAHPISTECSIHWPASDSRDGFSKFSFVPRLVALFGHCCHRKISNRTRVWIRLCAMERNKEINANEMSKLDWISYSLIFPSTNATYWCIFIKFSTRFSRHFYCFIYNLDRSEIESLNISEFVRRLSTACCRKWQLSNVRRIHNERERDSKRENLKKKKKFHTVWQMLERKHSNYKCAYNWNR